VADRLSILAGKAEPPNDAPVCPLVMDRSRHENLINEIREAGARVRLIKDGDISAALSCAFMGTNVHALMGIGAAPEGVISAAAMRSLGGHFQGQLIYDPEIVKTGEYKVDADGNMKWEEYSTWFMVYNDLIPVLVNAIKEHQAMLAARRHQNQVLEERIARMEVFLNQTK